MKAGDETRFFASWSQTSRRATDFTEPNPELLMVSNCLLGSERIVRFVKGRPVHASEAESQRGSQRAVSSRSRRNLQLPAGSLGALSTAEGAVAGPLESAPRLAASCRG